MNKNLTIYNNELIGLISILSVLNYHKKMSIGKSMLILPFFSHNNTLKVLKRKNIKVRSLEEFIIKYPSNFSNYNERFYSLLPVSINSIILLNRMKLISIKDGEILLKEDNVFEIGNKSLGNRAKEIILGAENLSQILMEDTKNLYLQLRVEL
ncbi:three component ABC system middle component [Metabacillus litoralis]|uniref:three component ABC system middle component n=1 Tax=Metabacillus litoralis TaxID=152268 RepID=UPI000EF5A459|nr:three component ABC system middle component [Metabacillus litoralis]